MKTFFAALLFVVSAIASSQAQGMIAVKADSNSRKLIFSYVADDPKFTASEKYTTWQILNKPALDRCVHQGHARNVCQLGLVFTFGEHFSVGYAFPGPGRYLVQLSVTDVSGGAGNAKQRTQQSAITINEPFSFEPKIEDDLF